jgi:hypothetical protein
MEIRRLDRFAELIITFYRNMSSKYPVRERRNTSRILTDKPERGSPFAKSGPRWEVSVKEILMDSAEWIHLAQDMETGGLFSTN